MALRLEDKKAIVDTVNRVASEAMSVVAADYRGLTVSQMTEFRVRARKAGLHAQVVRNTLARRAVEDTQFACLQEALTGPIILLFAKDDPGAGARLVRDFMKDNKQLEVRAISVGGALYNADALEKVAKLPTREQALSLLLSVMKAPITKLVRTMAEPYAQAVRVMGAIRDKKQH